MASRKKLSPELFKIGKESKEYGIPFWQCPNFIFLVVGGINIVSMSGAYFLGRYLKQEPELIILAATLLSIIIFVVGQGLTSGFRKLAEANKMKMEFVSIVSHQLRTPLTSMRWLLNLVLKEKESLPAEVNSYIRDILESNDRLIKLVNDLLNVNQIETGKILFSPEKINLAHHVEKTASLFEGLSRASNIEIIVNSEEESLVYFDPQKLEMILQNLFDNAIKYTKKDGSPHQVVVSIKKDGEFFKLSVKDEGVGIPQKDQSKIFSKFFRSGNIMRHQTSGTGLGLYLIRALAETGGGKAGFSSHEGEGSVFWITLPQA